MSPITPRWNGPHFAVCFARDPVERDELCCAIWKQSCIIGVSRKDSGREVPGRSLQRTQDFAAQDRYAPLTIYGVF